MPSNDVMETQCTSLAMEDPKKHACDGSASNRLRTVTVAVDTVLIPLDGTIVRASHELKRYRSGASSCCL